MEERFVFYTYGSTLELNGFIFSAGTLTEDLLNLSPEEYGSMFQRLNHILQMLSSYDGEYELWRDLNQELAALKQELCRWLVFRVLLGETVESEAPVDEPTTADWEKYQRWIQRFEAYLHDIRAFNKTIQNFIQFVLANLENNCPENYAAALYNFYHDPFAVDKLIVNPMRNYGDCYTTRDRYDLSYVPRRLPDGSAAICLEHTTCSLQALMKADYMLALDSGYNVRRCIICGKYFLLKSGVHALYCEGACPHAPRFTCRQFGTVEAQKELARDNPKIRIKLTAFERITKDMRRGAISREDARMAKNYVRDRLYWALRTPGISVEQFEESISSETVYAACKITRMAKPRGRPPKRKGGEKL